MAACGSRVCGTRSGLHNSLSAQPPSIGTAKGDPAVQPTLQEVNEAPEGNEEVHEAPEGSEQVNEAPEGNEANEAPEGNEEVNEAPKGNDSAGRPCA